MSCKKVQMGETQFFDNFLEASRVLDEINGEDLIGLDLEGVKLGEKTGWTTLVQISTRENVSLFDIQKCPNIMTTMKKVLENPSICKIVHDCRSDRTALKREFGIKLVNVFDTQLAYTFAIRGVKNGPWTRIGFNTLCLKLKLDCNPLKDAFHGEYVKNRGFWTTRPLTQDMMEYAAFDASNLLKFYDRLKPKVEEMKKYKVNDGIYEWFLDTCENSDLTSRKPSFYIF